MKLQKAVAIAVACMVKEKRRCAIDKKMYLAGFKDQAQLAKKYDEIEEAMKTLLELAKKENKPWQSLKK
jgi:hypothetical protein